MIARRRALAAAIGSLCVVLAGAGPASAHAVLLESSPTSGETLTSPPSEVVLRFSESVDPRLSSIAVTDLEGSSRSVGKAGSVAATELRIDVRRMDRGIMLTTWRAFSRVDGHVTVGSFAFGVNEDPAAVVIDEPVAPAPTAFSVLGRWAFLAGLTLILGAVALALAGGGSMPGWLAVGAGVAMVGLAAVGHQQRVDAGAPSAIFLGTSIGRALLWRGAGLLVVLGSALLARQTSRRVLMSGSLVAPSLAGMAAIAVVGVHVASGHAGAFGARDVIAQVLHVVAVGVWAGALLPIAIRLRREGSGAAPLVERFSRWALPAVVVVVATGTLRSVREIGGLDGFSSGYGRIVLAKIVTLLIVIGLAAANRRRFLPRAATDATRLTRLVGVETVLVAAMLAGTGLLANLAPPVQPSTSVAAVGMRAEGVSFAGDIRATLSVTPGLPGPNTLEVLIADPRSGNPILGATVSLRVRFRGRPGGAPLDVPLEAGNAGRYATSSTAFVRPGPYEVTVLVQDDAGSSQVLLSLGTVVPQDLTTIAGDPLVTQVTFTDESTVQLYLDPGATGVNEIHATYFDKSGRERSDVSGFAIVASNAAGARPLAPRVFSSGHAVASATLEPGLWRIDASVETSDGQVLSAWFETRL